MCNYCARVGGVKVNNQHADKYADLDQSTLYPHVLMFLRDMRTSGIYGQRTAEGVRSSLADLAAEFGRRPLNQFGPAFIKEWMSPERHPLADNTRRNRLSHAKKFGEWLVGRGKLKALPTREYGRIKLRRRDPMTLSEAEVETLFRFVAGDHRATVIVWLMVGDAARCCEVSNVRVEDYDPVGRMIRLTGKLDNQRAIPVPANVAVALDRYLDELGRVPGPLIRQLGNPYVGLKATTLSTYVSRWMKAAGIKTRSYDGKSAHALRRTAASDVMERTRDIYAVKRMLGHESIETTTIYLREVSDAVLRDAMEGRDYSPSTARPKLTVVPDDDVAALVVGS